MKNKILFIVTFISLSFTITTLYSQSQKSIAAQQTTFDPSDVVFVFHKITDADFPAIPQVIDDNSVKTYLKNVSYWLSLNADRINQAVEANTLENFSLLRSKIHALPQNKAQEFKKFYGNLETYISQVVHSKTITSGHIPLPAELYNQLVQFF